jgi:hypothetical protein
VARFAVVFPSVMTLMYVMFAHTYVTSAVDETGGLTPSLAVGVAA